MNNSPSDWEDQAVLDLQGSGIPELDGFQIEALSNQVDFEKDQLTLSTSHLLIAWVSSVHESGYIGADPVTLAFVAIVPGGSQRERRASAINAVTGIANWMRGQSPRALLYQPDRSIVERIHPLAVATLTATCVG